MQRSSAAASAMITPTCSEEEEDEEEEEVDESEEEVVSAAARPSSQCQTPITDTARMMTTTKKTPLEAVTVPNSSLEHLTSSIIYLSCYHICYIITNPPPPTSCAREESNLINVVGRHRPAHPLVYTRVSSSHFALSCAMRQLRLAIFAQGGGIPWAP